VNSPKIEYVWRIMQPIYTSGYDEVVLKFSDRKTLPIIEECTNLLIGFEIIKVDENQVIIKSVSKNLDEEFHTILRRVFLIVKQMLDIIYEIFREKNRKRFEEIYTLEQTVNKYTIFLKRIINRQGYKYHHYTYQIVTFLELAANHLEYMRRYFSKEKKATFDKEVLKELFKLKNFSDEVYELYYNYSDEKFRWIAEEQPHFIYFKKIKDITIKENLVAFSEYFVQIARISVALNL
jgi:phosphate uptake regulator